MSKETVDVVNRIRNGAQPVHEIPDEFVVAKRVPRPLGNDPLGEMAKMLGAPEFRLMCPICGMTAGHCGPNGDELWEECEGCLRRFSGIE